MLHTNHPNAKRPSHYPDTSPPGHPVRRVLRTAAPGPVTLRLREELMGIQYGERPDPHGWIHKIC